MCGSVIAAWAVGQVIHTAASDQAALEKAGRAVVHAELLEPIAATSTSGGPSFSSSAPFHARWITPGGMARTGRVDAPVDAEAGTTVRIWVDRRSGEITMSPLSREEVLTRTSLVVLLTILGCASIIAGVRFVTLRRTSRRQARTLEGEWRRIAAEWRRRHL
ncbi:hypothetical protein GCM10009658_34710 [Planotetraspora silvatica]